jgi:hypothetical protein
MTDVASTEIERDHAAEFQARWIEFSDAIGVKLRKLFRIGPAFGDFDAKISLQTDSITARFTNWLARPTGEKSGFIASGVMSFVVFPSARIRGAVVNVGRKDGHRFRFAASPGRLRGMAEELIRAADMLEEQAKAAAAELRAAVEECLPVADPAIIAEKSPTRRQRKPRAPAKKAAAKRKPTKAKRARKAG